MVMATTPWEWTMDAAHKGDMAADLSKCAPGTNMEYGHLFARADPDETLNAGSSPSEAFECKCRKGNPTVAHPPEAPDFQGFIFIDEHGDVHIDGLSHKELWDFKKSDLTFHPAKSGHIVVDTRHIKDKHGRVYQGWNAHREKRPPIILHEASQPQGPHGYPSAELSFPPTEQAN